jgi:hypothetical protein
MHKHAGLGQLSLIACDAAAAAAASVGLAGAWQPAGAGVASPWPTGKLNSTRAPTRVGADCSFSRCVLCCAVMFTGLPAVEGVAQWPPGQLLRGV